ncbi:MAG TPA: hypothetical protein VH497_13825 [Vicinamibacterales bacterium]|jgi:hypothetical protein
MERRTFLLGTGGALFSALRGLDGPVASTWLTLESQVGAAQQELVNVGVPFAPGLVSEPNHIRLETDRGTVVPAAVRVLERWRARPGAASRNESIRAARLQFRFDFLNERPTGVQLTVSDRSTSISDDFAPVQRTMLDPDGLKGPRIVARVSPDWLCASEVAGPQAPALGSGEFNGYDRFVERSFPGSLRYIDSDVYHHWLFDRTSTYYTQYVRTGERRYQDAASHCANFVRLHTDRTTADAGTFTLKGPDVKYVYPRAMHMHYLLTGDERALETGKLMARFCLERWDPRYRPDQYVQPPLGVDPEKDRKFWSTRHEAYGLLGVLHGWEMTGDQAYWRRILEYVDALAAHQAQPPDGRPADGSWRQNWALYDPNETLLAGGASPWMTAILLSALFHAWRVTGDDRIPGMVTRWCDFLDRKGFIADGSRVHYVVDCFGENHLDEAPGPQGQGMERHSTELAYSFAMGHFFSKDAEQRARFRKRFDRLFAIALTIDANMPERCYNWAFQASSQLVYFMNRV